MDQLFRNLSRKRKMAEEDDDEYEELFGRPSGTIPEEDNTIIFAGALAGAVACAPKKRKKRKRNEERVSNWWDNGYLRWDDTRFKQHFRITRDSFDRILTVVTPFIQKTPTNLCPNPTSPATQLGLTLYH